MFKYIKAVDLVHDGQKRFKCDRCDAGFIGKYNLKLHNEVHLKLHVTAIHEGNKPFKCSICVESFTVDINRSNVIDVVKTL